jgi:3-phosphoshikimate 1-carboxyvinyltransferase
MQRACAAALIKQQPVVLHNPGISNDDLAAIDILKNFGIQVNVAANGTMLLQPNNNTQDIPTLHCGESGLGIRMFTPLVSHLPQGITITGEGSLLTRPMHFFEHVLPQLGVKVSTNNGCVPIHIQGPLVPNNITIDGSLSSQFLTGLLFAYAKAYANGYQQTTTINVVNLKSKPYIDLTLHIMQVFELPVPQNNNYRSFVFEPTQSSSTASITYQVEGDWSGAAFLLVAGAINGNLTVKGLDVFSTQADKAILQALMDCGCRLSIQPEQIEVSSLPLKAFHFNATDCPDLFPPLVALAANATGTSVIEGVHRLAHKESNRALTLQATFAKLGVDIRFQDDMMLIKGTSQLQGATVSSHHDHRIAMACAVAALKCNSAVTITEANAVAKSYPNFYQHLQQVGVSIQQA